MGGKKPNSFSITLSRSISYPYKIQQQNRFNQFQNGGGQFGGGQFGGGFGGGGFGGGQFGGGFGGGFPTAAQDDSTAQAQSDAHFNSTSLSFSLGKRLKWPDDYFSLSNSLSFSLIVVEKLDPERGKVGLSILFLAKLVTKAADTDCPSG